jgi:hypothetical protein
MSLKTEFSGERRKEVNISRDITGISEGMAAAAAESDDGVGTLEGRVRV